MSVNSSDIVNKYSENLPCRTCKYALTPIGEFERCGSALCEIYNAADNMKPYGVLFGGEKCEYYEKGNGGKAKRYDDSDDSGRWITTENGHKVFIDENGNPTKGNPHVIDAMTDGERKIGKMNTASKNKPEVSGRSKNDFLPKNSYRDTPEVQKLVKKRNEAWKKADEIWKERENVQKEMKSEFTPKDYSEISDDDLDNMGYLGTRPGIFTEKGKELEKEEKRLWKEYKKVDWERNRASDEITIAGWKARAEQLKNYQQPELKKAESDNYEGFTTETTGTSWGDGILKSGRAFIAEMSPKEYLERCAFEIFSSGTLESTIAPVHMEDVNKYSEMMKNGTKFDLPWLDYNDRGQEGRHRAVAAYLLGIDKIPVLIAGTPPSKDDLEWYSDLASMEAKTAKYELEEKLSERMDSEDEGRWITTKNNHKVHLNENGEPDMGNQHVIEKMVGGNSEKLAYAQKKYRNIAPKLKSKRDELDAYDRDIKRKEELTAKARDDLEKAKVSAREAKERKEKLGGKSYEEIKEERSDAYYRTERCKRALKYLEEEKNSGNESEVLERLSRNGYGNFQSLDEAVSMIEEHRLKEKDEYDRLSELAVIADRYGRDGGVKRSEAELSECEKNLQRCEKNEEETKKRRGEAEEEYKAIHNEAEEAREYYNSIAQKELVSIDFCETTEDVETMLDAGGYFRDGTSAKFGDLNVESARYIANAVDQLAERYPYLKGKLVRIETEKMTDSNLGGYISEQKRIVVNEKVFSDIERLDERYRKSTEEGIHPYGTGADAIIYHEYAHQIDDLLSEGMPNGERFSTHVLNKVAQAMGEKRPSMLKDMVSQYAMREYPYNKDGDFFAEALAEYLSSDRPREIARRVGAIFERRLLELKRENRMDAEEDENQNGGGNHGNTRIPYGLCQKEGIDIGKDWTPTDAWEALKGKGYNPDEVYENLKKTGKATKAKKLTDEEYKAVWQSYKDRFGGIAANYYDEKTDIERELRESGREILDILPEVKKATRAVEDAKKNKKSLTGRSEEELQELIDKENKIILECEKLRKDVINNPPGSDEEFEALKKRAREAGVDLSNKLFEKMKFYDYEDLMWYVQEHESSHETARYWLLKEAKILREFGPDGGVAEAEKALDGLNATIEQKWAAREEIKEKQRSYYEKLEEEMKEFDAEREKCMEAARERFPTIDDCKTRQDLAEKMFGDGLFTKTSGMAYFANINFDSAKEVAKTIYEFVEKNPELKGEITQVMVSPMPNNRFGQTKEYGAVQINKMYFESLSKIKKSCQECVRKGFHPEGTDHRFIIMHEYSHQLDFYMTKKLGLPKNEMFSDRVLKEVSEKLGLDPNECKSRVSSYAMKEYPDGKNSCEFLAEAYGEFLNSQSPREVARAVGETVQKYMKQLRHDSRMDDDEEDTGGSHGNTRIPFGLCEREGIEIGKDWTPSDAWEALKGKGYNPEEVYENLRKTGKADNPAKKTNWREESQEKLGAAWAKLTDAESNRDKSKEETAIYSMRVEVTENEAKNAKKAVELAEEINGRSAEQLEADADELDNQIQEWNAAIKKSKRRPKAGTPEKEEWDEWYRSVGGKSGIEWMKQQAEWKEQDYERLNELWQMMTENPNVGDLEAKKAEYEKAVKKQERTRSKYEESAARTKNLEAEVEEAKRERDEARAERFHTAREQIKSYDECENAEDVSDRLNGGDYFKTGSRADFAEVDLDYAKRVASATETFFERHQILKGKLGSVRSDSYMIYHEGGRAYAGSEFGGDILLNPNKFGNPEQLQKDLSNDIAKGFHPPETTVESLIIHEYTHQLDHYLSRYTSRIAPNAGYAQFSSLVIDEVRNNLGLSFAEVVEAVSGYAKSGDDEWLAEAYSEAMTAKNPRPVATEVGKVVMKYIKKYEEYERGLNH